MNNLKTLREEYSLPLCVLKGAVSKDKSDRLSDKRLRELCSAYADRLRQRPLTSVVVGTSAHKNKIAVVRILAEDSVPVHSPYLHNIANSFAHEALVNGKEAVLNRNIDVIMASVGEHFKLDDVCIIDAGDKVAASYCHGGRFASVVVLSADGLSDKEKNRIVFVGNTIAKHAIAGYAAYISKDQCFGHLGLGNTLSFREALLDFPYIMGDGVISTECTYNWKKIVSKFTLNDYLQLNTRFLARLLNQPEVKIKLEEVKMFGF